MHFFTMLSIIRSKYECK